MLRTHTCGDLRKDHLNKEITLCGWVWTRRDHGGVIFIDLRDRYGVTQLVIYPQSKVFKEADKLRREDVIQATGRVVKRKQGMENDLLKTGAVEIEISELKVLNHSEVPPLEIENKIVASDEVRLKYRYLDLRRPVMQQNFLLRHNAAQAAREYLNSRNFLEIETPLLMKSTPEGARDYVVPSRVNPGKFYALPQSPQLYKQLLMVSGFDRYYQLARCLRDEDLRADRQPEFTQIDLEMSFVEQQDVLDIVEGTVKHIVDKTIGRKLPKFKVLPYQESMDRFGTDKPDMRFGLELIDVTDIAKKSDFSIFKEAEAIKCMYCPKDMTRGDIDKLIEWVKEQGGKGLAWARVKGDVLESSIVKYFSTDIQKKLIEKAKAKEGILFFSADKRNKANALLGKVRTKLGDDLKLIDRNALEFVWILDFPMFEWNEEDSKWEPMHHMFTMPKKEFHATMEKEPGKVIASLYDLVLNGTELGSGSIRVHVPEIQERIMKIVGYPKEQAEARFGFLIEAFRYGAPPHGGFAIGFDRIVALLSGTTDIREVVAFPKNKNAQCPMDGSPSELAEKDLAVLKLKVEHKKQ